MLEVVDRLKATSYMTANGELLANIFNGKVPMPGEILQISLKEIVYPNNGRSL